jgi:hypothetical protein
MFICDGAYGWRSHGIITAISIQLKSLITNEAYKDKIRKDIWVRAIGY